MKKLVFPIIVLLFSFGLFQKSYAHCEIPCGIYGDELRIAMLYEDILTIEKSMDKITELSAAEKLDIMTITRWTMAKEDHANKIQDVVSQYFITQRIKLPEVTEGPEFEKYENQLALLHQLIVYAMKAKQTTDKTYIEKLRKSLSDFEAVYFEGKHRHKIEHHD
jgi:nickel superoxide dismutase